MKKTLSALCALVLGTALCVGFVACGGEEPTAQQYEFESFTMEYIGQDDDSMYNMIADTVASIFEPIFEGNKAYFSGDKFVWEISGTRSECDYTEEDGVYNLTVYDSFEGILGFEMSNGYVTFDDETLTLTYDAVIDMDDMMADVGQSYPGITLGTYAIRETLTFKAV